MIVYLKVGNDYYHARIEGKAYSVIKNGQEVIPMTRCAFVRLYRQAEQVLIALESQQEKEKLLKPVFSTKS
ncbi:MAG: hypothetical protein QXS74_06380 [Nitrososphaeria archaeon]